MNFIEALTAGDVSVAINRMAHEIAKEEGKKATKKPYATRVKKQKKGETVLRDTLKKSFGQYQERMKHGIKLLASIGLLGGIDPQKVITFLTQMGSPESTGKIIQHEVGLSDKSMVSIHECGVKFFDEKDFVSAADVFLILTYLNPFVPSFWISLGMSEEMKSDFDGAALAFIMAAETNEEGYSWAIRGAECLIKAGKDERAHRLLDTVIEETGKSPKYAALQHAAMNAKKASR